MDLNTVKNLTSKNYMNVFSRRNVCFVKGEGNVLTDTNGKEYVDFDESRIRREIDLYQSRLSQTLYA
jgi:acetylornithine/succinyldiaminopimelate/putrescine aminotransferase